MKKCSSFNNLCRPNAEFRTRPKAETPFLSLTWAAEALPQPGTTTPKPAFSASMCAKCALSWGKRAHPSGIQSQPFELTQLKLPTLIRSKQKHLEPLTKVNKIQIISQSFCPSHCTRGKWSWQLSWRIPVPEKRPEPNSTTEPLPVPLSNRDLSSSQMGAKEQNSSSDPAEGTNTCFLWSWGMLSLCWGEFRAPIKPGEHSLLFLTAQKARKKICFLPLVATKFHQWFLQKPKGKQFSWIRERDQLFLGNCSIPEFTYFFWTPSARSKSSLFWFVGSFF